MDLTDTSSNLPGNPLYRTLCRLITDRAGEMDWNAFSRKDWDALARRAVEEGVGPLSYDALKRSGFNGLKVEIPEPALQILTESYYQTAAHNALLYRELGRVLEALGDAEVPAIVLKGAALAATLYPDPALRPMGDLDLLVAAGQFETASTIVRGLGYQEIYPDAGAGLTRAMSHHLHLRKVGNRLVAVEVHHSLIASRAHQHTAPVDWFWQQQEPVDLMAPGLLPEGFQAPALALTPTAHLLYLAAHAMLQHGGGRALILWLYDLDLLIRSWEARIDWELLLYQAGQLQWEAALGAAFSRLAADFGTTPVPPAVREQLAVPDASRNAALVRLKSHRARTRLQLELQVLATLDWRTRLRLVAALLFPAPAYMRWRYQPRPAWLWPLYYPYRWADILGDGLRTLLGGRPAPAPVESPERSGGAVLRHGVFDTCSAQVETTPPDEEDHLQQEERGVEQLF